MSQTESGATIEAARWRSGPSMAYPDGRLLRVLEGRVEVYEEKQQQWRDIGTTELPAGCTPTARHTR